MKNSIVIALAILSLAASVYAAESYAKALAAEVRHLDFTKTRNTLLEGVYLKPTLDAMPEIDHGNYRYSAL
jgi:hypothetical protein